jgi:hypothetical protein
MSTLTVLSGAAALFAHELHVDPGGERARWFWAMNASGPGINRSGVNCSGIVDTRAEAVSFVEEPYWGCLTWRSRSGGGRKRFVRHWFSPVE